MSLQITKAVYLCNAQKLERYERVRQYQLPCPTEYFFNVRYPEVNPAFIDAMIPQFWHHKYNMGGLLGSISCAIGHYNIIKTNYLRGVENLLVLEDDVRVADTSALLQIPDDADVTRFSVYAASVNPEGGDYHSDGNMYTLTRCLSANAGAYILSRKGMKAYIDYMDNRFTYADMFFWECPLLKNGELRQYWCNLPVFEQRFDDTTIGYNNIV